MIFLEQVTTKKQVKEFVNFPLDLYKNNPYYVPQFYADEIKLFLPKNRTTEKYYSEAFLVKEVADNAKKPTVVGRVACILHKQYNSLFNEKTVRFSRLDFIDNFEVAKILMDCVENFAKQHGMKKIIGPIGITDQDREGLLTNGFDSLSTFVQNYNYPYYYEHLKQCGYLVDAEWDEWQVTRENVDEAHFSKMSDIVLKRYKLHVADKKCSTRSIIKKYKYSLFDLVDETYAHLYGYVPLSHADIDRILKSLSIALKKDYFCFILDEHDNMVAFGISMPGISHVLNGTRGKLTLPTIIKLLHAINHPKFLEMLLIGVKDEYKLSGLPFIIFNEIHKIVKKKKITYAETNAQLKTNEPIHKLFEHLNPKHMRDRVALCKEVD